MGHPLHQNKASKRRMNWYHTPTYCTYICTVCTGHLLPSPQTTIPIQTRELEPLTSRRTVCTVWTVWTVCMYRSCPPSCFRRCHRDTLGPILTLWRLATSAPLFPDERAPKMGRICSSAGVWGQYCTRKALANLACPRADSDSTT